MAITDGRKTNGGARAGAGRKPNEARDELARLLDKAVPLADRIEILAKQGSLAKAGDIKAATLLLAYLYGRPIERQEVTGAGGGATQIVVKYQEPVTKDAPDDDGDD